MMRNRVFALLTATLMLSLTLAPRTTGQSGSQQITWVNQINCTASGNSLEKTGGLNDTADAAARSQQTIAAGDAYYEFSAAQTNRLLFTGLSHAAIGTDFNEIDFAIKLTDFGVAEVRENNAYRAEARYNAGDTFRIADEGGVVKYYQNGSLLYVSQNRPAYPLIADTVFIAMNGRITNTVIGALSINAASEWPMFQHDAAHTGTALASRINASNLNVLNQSWGYQTGGGVSGTPVVAGGVVYAGSADGRMYALRESDGQVVWSALAGQVSTNACNATFGIDSTAAVVSGRLYVGAANASLYAFNAADGSVIWRTQLGDASQGFHLWSSPLVFDGKVYVGVASHCDVTCVRGSVVALSTSNGAVLWQTYTAPQGSTGGGVRSSLAVDPQRRLVFATTGALCQGTDTYSNAILALNADSGAVAWQFKNTAGNRGVQNLGFVASPVLFDISGLPMLAVGSQDGYVYAMRRDTGELQWATPVTDGSANGGIVATAAAANGKLYVGARAANGTGKLVALEQRLGQLVWEQAQSAPVTGAAAVVNGLVFVGGGDGALRAYEAETGAPLWSAQRGAMTGGVSVTSDRVFVGSNDRSVYSFQLNAVPQRATINVTSPVGGDLWRKNQNYNVTWSIAGSVSRVDVALSRDGGTTWTTLATNVDAGAGSLTVTASKPKSRQVVVRVSATNDSSVFGLSGTFRIK